MRTNFRALRHQAVFPVAMCTVILVMLTGSRSQTAIDANLTAPAVQPPVLDVFLQRTYEEQKVTPRPSIAHIKKTDLLSEREWEIVSTKRRSLLQSTLTLEIAADLAGKAETKYQIPLAAHPEWIITQRSARAPITVTLDQAAVRAYIEREIAVHIPRASHLRILGLADPRHLATAGEMVDGWVIDTAESAARIADAVSRGVLRVSIPALPERGTIVDEANMFSSKPTLLARGVSDFGNSVPNRIYNIEKALYDHITNVYVPRGAMFSFNEIIGNDIEVYTGWKMAMGIFNGNELKLTPGGGICQASTTLYRATLQAGLPINEQRNHSMYIPYYSDYGEGLDATIYPGDQDLVFTNDTPGPLLIRAYTSGTKAFVELYGIGDGRQVALEGPYRYHNAPPDIRAAKLLGKNDIAWRQRIAYQDGNVTENTLISRYKTTVPWKTPEYAGVLEGRITN